MIYSSFKSHLNLSKIAFGGAAISGDGGGYGFGKINDDKSIELLHAAMDAGINLFDTAPIYGFHESEKKMGLAFKKCREDVHIISKCGVDWHDNKRVNMSNDPKVCQNMLDRSLRHLSYIDTYMIHWPDQNVDIRYTLEVLQNAKDKKDIHFIGLCNTHNSDLEKAKEVCDVDMIQCEANLFNNAFDVIEYDGFKTSWGTFDKGILTGSVTKNRIFSNEDCRSWAPWWKKSNWKQKVEKVQKLKNNLYDHSLVEIALGFALNMTSTNSAICGFRSIEQLNSIIDALDNLPDIFTLNKIKDEL